MDLLPILSALRRHKAAATLLVLEVAVTCAIVCNAVFLITERRSNMQHPSGVLEQEIIEIKLADIQDDDASGKQEQDLDALRSIPGVRSVAYVNQIPFGSTSWSGALELVPDAPESSLDVSIYLGSEDLVETFGLDVVAGRDFEPDEYLGFDEVQNPSGGGMRLGAVMLTRATAERLFPGHDALGENVYIWSDEPARVVGIIDRLERPDAATRRLERDMSVVLPVRLNAGPSGDYVLQVDPMEREAILEKALEALDRVDPNRVVVSSSMLTALRAKRYRADHAMAWMLGGVCIALLLITALGIIGLASFWVQQRHRQIGIRRALGATRGQILRDFRLENFVLVTLGIVLGMALAYGVNAWLMAHYELSRLPAYYLPVGAGTLWALGQIAVLGPARQAAAVPPAVATRNL